MKKRILALFLTVVYALGMFSTSAVAEETEGFTPAQMTKEFKERSVEMFWFMLFNGFSQHSGDISAAIVHEYMLEEQHSLFEEYLRIDEEYIEDVCETYYVPEDIYVKEADKFFDITEDMETQLKEEPCYTEEDGINYYVVKYLAGGAGDSIKAVYYGYEELENGNYKIYMYVYDQASPVVAEEVADMTEDVDYIKDGESFYIIKECYEIEMKIDGDKYQMLTYVQSVNSVLANEKIVTEDEAVVAYEVGEGVKLEADAAFEGGTVVKCEKITSGEIFNKVDVALEEISDKYVIFEITAVKDSVSVQPNGKVKLTLDIPKDFDDSVAVLYVDEEGRTKELESTVDAEKKTVSVELEHFSTYVIADVEEDNKEGEKESSTPSEKEEAPLGGDTFNLVVCVAVLVISTVSFGVANVTRRREE